jgi:hypothetical protein
MATPRLQISDLDFDQIKTNLKSYLKQQSQFQDYDFEGSGLNILLDILAYNTHYNSYYLNMVANESFMDTALLRDSVVSHAKTLGYTPYSVTSPVSKVNITVESGSTTPSTLTIPKGFAFNSNLIDNISYNFVTLEEKTVTKANTSFYFENLDIYEGSLVSYSFNYIKNSNPKSIFVLPNSNIDTSSISVTVTPNAGNTSSQVYNQVTEILDITSDSAVYFLQESKNGNYEIYFGDGVIGKKLTDGAIVTVNYLITNGENANAADGFSPSSTIGGFSNITIDVVGVAAGGSNRESVDSIKYSSSSQYATQNRLVTVNDYESYIKNKYPSIDSLSVWGGEDEVPPIYGKVLISLKPKENYFLSQAEKQRIITEIVDPKSIISVSAEIRDPEYLYILLNNEVKYDPKKTILSETQFITQIRNAIINFKEVYLNKFNAVFALSKMQEQINNVDINSIIGSKILIKLQKRITPKLNINSNYVVNFGVQLKRGTLSDRLVSSEFNVLDSTSVRRIAIIEEVPQSFTGVSSIEIFNAGYGFTSTPTITISGDGTGATAEAVIQSGRIVEIKMTNRGSDYTRATVSIIGGDGFNAVATAVIDSRIGTLRTIFFDENANRQIINSNAGEINYNTGTITLNDLKIISVFETDGLLRLTAFSENGVIESAKNTIITIDETDPISIVTVFKK